MDSPVGSSEIRVVIRAVETPGFRPELVPARFSRRSSTPSWLRWSQPTRKSMQNRSRASFSFRIWARDLASSASSRSKDRSPQAADPRSNSSDAAPVASIAATIKFFCGISGLCARFTGSSRRSTRPMSFSCSTTTPNCRWTRFFCRQVDRVGGPSEVQSGTEAWFAGTAITSFEGRLEIDRLSRPGLERLPDPSRRYDSNRLRVRQIPGRGCVEPLRQQERSVTGRAIYTGDSQLPERIEVLKIEEQPRAADASRHPGLVGSSLLMGLGRRA